MINQHFLKLLGHICQGRQMIHKLNCISTQYNAMQKLFFLTVWDKVTRIQWWTKHRTHPHRTHSMTVKISKQGKMWRMLGMLWEYILQGELNPVWRIRKCLTDKVISKLRFGEWVEDCPVEIWKCMGYFGLSPWLERLDWHSQELAAQLTDPIVKNNISSLFKAIQFWGILLLCFHMA